MRGPREPSAIMIIRSPRRSTLTNERAEETAFLKVDPPIGNQLVILIKDTSLVSAIGIIELTLSGKMVIERSGASFEVFLFIAALYLLLTTAFGLILRFFEIHLRKRQ